MNAVFCKKLFISSRLVCLRLDTLEDTAIVQYCSSVNGSRHETLLYSYLK